MIKKITGNTVVSVARVLIAAMSLVCVMSFVGCKKEEVKTTAKQETTQEMEGDVDTSKTETTAESVSKSSYVENATYAVAELEGKSYKLDADDTKEYSMKDIVVPNIKIDSDDAKKANDEIKSIFDAIAKEFSAELNETEHMSYCTANYEAYENNGILSVLLTIETGGTDVPQHMFYTYNFDLTTKATVDYNTLITKAGYTADTAEAKVKEAIKTGSSLKEITEEDCEEGKNIDTYVDESLTNFKEEVDLGKVRYILGDNGKLGVNVSISFPTGGYFDEFIIIG